MGKSGEVAANRRVGGARSVIGWWLAGLLGVSGLPLAGSPLAAAAASGAVAGGTAMATVRVKDLARLQGDRANQVMGLGLVVGLAGTGDSSSSLASQMASNLLEHFGLSVSNTQVRSRNVAAVMVTATLPASFHTGDTVDLTVSSIGDARSLQGGVLLQTPLLGADQQVYVVGQGSVLVGGFAATAAGGGGASQQKNHPTVGRVPGGGIAEREIPGSSQPAPIPTALRWVLRQADYTTAQRVADAIRQALPEVTARPVDAATVEVSVPAGFADQVVDLIAQVENVEVVPDSEARVVINERTGTVVIGAHVRVAPVAVAQGSLRVQIGPAQVAVVPVADQSQASSEPSPTGAGPAAVVPTPAQPSPAAIVATGPTVQVNEEGGAVALIAGQQTLEDLVAALNAIGASPRDLIAIFQALQDAGALYGQLIIQ